MKKVLLSSVICFALVQFAAAQSSQKTTANVTQAPSTNQKVSRTPKSGSIKPGRQKKTVRFLMPIEESKPVEKKVSQRQTNN